MNDSMSVLLATSVLSVCGFGLYMYKSRNLDTSIEDSEIYNEESLFGDHFCTTTTENNTTPEVIEEDVPRKSKTNKHKKNNGKTRKKW